MQIVWPQPGGHFVICSHLQHLGQCELVGAELDGVVETRGAADGSGGTGAQLRPWLIFS